MDANGAVSPHWSAFWDRPRECLNSIFHWTGNVVIWHFRHCLHRESCQKDNLRYSHLRKCRPNETFQFQLERVRIESMGNWGTKYPSQVKSYFRGEKSILALVGWQMLPISCEASLLYHNRDYKNDKHNCLQSKTDRSTRRCYFGKGCCVYGMTEVFWYHTGKTDEPTSSVYPVWICEYTHQ